MRNKNWEKRSKPSTLTPTWYRMRGWCNVNVSTNCRPLRCCWTNAVSNAFTIFVLAAAATVGSESVCGCVSLLLAICVDVNCTISIGIRVQFATKMPAINVTNFIDDNMANLLLLIFFCCPLSSFSIYLKKKCALFLRLLTQLNKWPNRNLLAIFFVKHPFLLILFVERTIYYTWFV